MKTSPLIEERLKKLEELCAEGIAAYPNDIQPQDCAADLQEKYEAQDREALESSSQSHSIAGRMMSARLFGKAGFAHLKDATGKIQIFVEKQSLSEEEFKLFKKSDIGDFLWVEGRPMRTKTGELSLRAQKLRLAAKSLRPLPEKWHGLSDVEMRYRQRYVDIIVNDSVGEVIRQRSRVINLIRAFFTNKNFLEVETPMMHPLAGGAAARPFETHHNALDLDLKLRIAPELYLKRLVVGGLERVFELNRNFRNEGISTQHNPEFTMLEFYQAYARSEDLMCLTEDLLESLAHELFGGTEFVYQEQELSFKKPFQRVRFDDSLVEIGELPKEILSNETAARKLADEHGIRAKPGEGLAALHAAFLEKFVEPKLIQPTYITEFPAAISPLARRNDNNPDYTERFELYIAAKEIANGFSELNDPLDQEERFRKQVEAGKQGDHEAMPFDEDFIEALSYGMPPTAGEGIGIDRLVMLLTDQASIRDVICFPLLRPERPA
jgi:lysyl-tRNA synthetase, class II